MLSEGKRNCLRYISQHHIYKLKAYPFPINPTHVQKYTHIFRMGVGRMGEGSEGAGKKNNIDNIKIKIRKAVWTKDHTVPR